MENTVYYIAGGGLAVLIIVIILIIRGLKKSSCPTLQLQMQEDAVERIRASFWIGSPEDLAELTRKLRQTASDYVDARAKK